MRPSLASAGRPFPWLRAICLALPLLGIGVGWLVSLGGAETRPELQASESAPPAGAPGGNPEGDAEPRGETRSLPDGAARGAGVASEDPGTRRPSETADGPLRLRFLRGTSGRPAAGLEVRILSPRASAEDEFEFLAGAAPGQSAGFSGALPMHLITDGEVLAEGRTDAHGLLEAPRALLGRGMLLDVGPRAEEAGPGTAVESRGLVAEPNWIVAEHFPAGSELFEVRVFGPWAEFRARVLTPGREPVANAVVQFDFESPSLAFSTRDPARTRVPTDGEGRASFALIDAASSGGRLRVRAEAAWGAFSETLELAPPLAGEAFDLVLSNSGRAVVRVAQSDGVPLGGAMARLERLDPPFGSTGRSTDGEGVATFSPVEPGRYAASAEDPATGARARSEFTLVSCQVAELALALPPSELPLAVAGRVRGPAGEPIAWLRVSVCVDGREEARLAPDSAGRFVYHRAPCATLRVRLSTPFDGPRVEPEVLDVPFGARDLEFTLRDAPALAWTPLRVLDAETGEPIGGARAVLFRDSAAERVAGFVSTVAGGLEPRVSSDAGWLVLPSGADLPRAHLVVEKRGYVRREIDVADLARLPQQDGAPALELARGFSRRFLVLDARSLAPIPGARATAEVLGSEGRLVDLGATPADGRGVLEIALARTPERIRIEAEGHAAQWLEALSVAAIGDTVLLEPRRP